MNVAGPLPSKTEAERAVLGAALVDEKALRIAQQYLSVPDFFVPAHRRIFAEMQRLAKDGQPVELVTMCDALQRDSEVAGAGGPAFVASLCDGIYRNAPVEAWAKSVLEASVLRRAALSGELLVKHALEPGACIESLAVQAAALQKTLACQPTQVGGFDLVHLGDLLAKPDTPVDWVLQNTLLAGGVSGVFAKPKVGKSTFCRNLCLAVARGDDFLGLKTKQGECVYLALEEREDDIRNDFRSMGADGSEAIFVHAASAPADGIDALCDLVRQRCPVLVVIDPLFRLAHIRDEKAYAETYAALGPLIDVAREVGTHVLLSHHAGKGMKSDAVDSPLGSTAIGGAVSTLVILKRSESIRTIQTVQRVGADLPETVLRFDCETHRLGLGGTRFEADRQECEAAMLDFLRDTRDPQSQAQIRDGVQGKTATIRAALTELVRSSRVSKTGGGTKGKPFLYAFEDSGSQYISGTREPESQREGQAVEYKERMLVPENSQKSILVPDNGERQKRFEEGEL